uniref:Ig-like domain-containing protein n=1 Tax=Macrostomum lignano TaxID=282301 RepID=A0A1I8GLG3_9PLAT
MMLRQTSSGLLLAVGLLMFGWTCALEPTSVDVLENDWYEFECVYNAQDDKNKVHELTVHIQDCYSSARIALSREHFSSATAAVAVVFGKTSSQQADIKSELMKNQNWPMYYTNSENAYLKEGLVKIVSGDVNKISIKVNVTNRMDRRCISCNQIKSYLDLEPTKKEALKIRRPPTASATVNGAALQPTSPATALQLNQTVTIICTASGPAQLSVTLLKDNREIASKPASNSLTHVIAKAGRDSAGVYKCQAETDLPFLVQRSRSSGSLEFVLAVNFGNKENIRIRVQSYPAARLECSPTGDVLIRESYNDREFSNEYDLTLTNLDSVKKESKFRCTATNEVGQRQLDILLTAKAPTPEILSSVNTKWSNSYRLEWQHDQNASIDHYLVEIVYRNRDDNSEVNRTEIKFSPTQQKGSIALVDGDTRNGKLIHSGQLVNLTPDSNHDIRLRSCNEHGCSEYTPTISVRTQAQTALSSDAANLVGMIFTWLLLTVGLYPML